MSNDTNEKLLEEAQFFADFCEGTALARLIEADIESGDLENLQFHLRDARGIAFELEYDPLEGGLQYA